MSNLETARVVHHCSDSWGVEIHSPNGFMPIGIKYLEKILSPTGPETLAPQFLNHAAEIASQIKLQRVSENCWRPRLAEISVFDSNTHAQDFQPNEETSLFEQDLEALWKDLTNRDQQHLPPEAWRFAFKQNFCELLLELLDNLTFTEQLLAFLKTTRTGPLQEADNQRIILQLKAGVVDPRLAAVVNFAVQSFLETAQMPIRI